MLQTKTNNIIKNNTTILISFLLITLTLFTILLSTQSRAQSTIPSSSTSSASNSSTTTGTPIAIYGTGIAGNTIKVTFPDGTTATTTVKSDGTYSIMPLTSQVAGNITVTELSPTGVVVTPAKTLPYVGGSISSMPATPTSGTPKLSITDPYLCPGKISGNVDNNKAIVTIEISKAGTVVLTLPATVNSNGSWAVDIANKLPDGPYTNKFTATFNGMVASGTYDFNHKNTCPSNSTSSTIRTGGMNLIASITSLSAIVLGLCVLMIKKFTK